MVSTEYSNLNAVPESVFEVRSYAFVTSPDVHVEDCDDLKPYSMGTVTGWKIRAQDIARVQPRAYFVLDSAQPMAGGAPAAAGCAGFCNKSIC